MHDNLILSNLGVEQVVPTLRIFEKENYEKFLIAAKIPES